MIVVAGNFDNPPGLFADMNDPWKPLGVAPELSAAMGEILGVEFEWRNTQWPGQLPGLDAGTFDLAWGQITVTEQREREILDVIPWAVHSLGLLVPEGNPEGITNWSSACGHSVAVAPGSIFVNILHSASDAHCVSAGLQPIIVREYQGDEVTSIRSGQAEAALDSHTVLHRMAEGMGQFGAVELPYEETREYSGMAGIAMKKEDVGLANALVGALRVLHENGTWMQIANGHDAQVDVPALDQVAINVLSGTPAGTVAPATE
ncbi:MAG: transporter substrate-binding domain-containing protein [Rhodobacteraceae bacterium]|nr:transporter substrate-binding domain-containing protein [Paracoccaceae bacterium]